MFFILWDLLLNGLVIPVIVCNHSYRYHVYLRRRSELRNTSDYDKIGQRSCAFINLGQTVPTMSLHILCCVCLSLLLFAVVRLVINLENRKRKVADNNRSARKHGCPRSHRYSAAIRDNLVETGWPGSLPARARLTL